jgi:NADPH:quinone reductase-like Zn-dependent oxidoreductase
VKAFEVREATGLDGLVLNRQRAEPVPQRNEILIKMRAVSLNFRDLGVIRGAYGYTKFPVIPVSDGAGEVIAVGNDVTRFRVGDRVAGTFFQNWPSGRIPVNASKNSLGGMIDGMLTQLRALPAEGAVKIPDHLSFEEGATLPVAGLTAWHALVEAGRIKAGETVVVLGTGGVSCFALQFAKLHGARVILTSSCDEKFARGKALGADDLINYRKTPEWDAEVLKLTDGIGADHIVEVGGPGTIEKSLKAVRMGGTLSVIGAVSGPGQIDPRPINRKAITLHGIHVGSREMFEAMNRAITQSGLKPFIDRVFSFEDAKAAYEHMMSGQHFGKIVVRTI